MTNDQLSDLLKTAREALASVTTDIQVSGHGTGLFLTANRGSLGIEFYLDGDQFVIDPAIDGELQGEQVFPSMDQALRYASNWLTRQTV